MESQNTDLLSSTKEILGKGIAELMNSVSSKVTSIRNGIASLNNTELSDFILGAGHNPYLNYGETVRIERISPSQFIFHFTRGFDRSIFSFKQFLKEFSSLSGEVSGILNRPFEVDMSSWLLAGKPEKVKKRLAHLKHMLEKEGLNLELGEMISEKVSFVEKVSNAGVGKWDKQYMGKIKLHIQKNNFSLLSSDSS